MHVHAHIGDPATWGSRVLVLAVRGAARRRAQLRTRICGPPVWPAKNLIPKPILLLHACLQKFHLNPGRIQDTTAGLFVKAARPSTPRPQYGFLIVIIVHLYTATLASRLTALRLANNVKSKADLPGKPVETWCAAPRAQAGAACAPPACAPPARRRAPRAARA